MAPTSNGEDNLSDNQTDSKHDPEEMSGDDEGVFVSLQGNPFFPDTNYQDETEDAEVPLRKVIWKLGGHYVAKTDAGYPMGPPLFDSSFSNVPVEGKRKHVKFTFQWLWSIDLADSTMDSLKYSPAEKRTPSVRSSGRRRKRPASSEDDDSSFDEESNAMRRGPKRMTARQRAMANKTVSTNLNGHLMSLPMKMKSSEKVLTEAQLLKKSENARKRRLALLKQTEETKSTTVERLLMKTGNREKRKARQLKKLNAAMIEKKQAEPKEPTSILYKCTSKPIQVPKKEDEMDEDVKVKSADTTHKPQVRIEVSFPKSLEAPLDYMKMKPQPRSLPKCANKNCNNPRRYRCKANGLPLCAQMVCYRAVVVLNGT
ncbi:hypothetical protein AAMO2058_000386500 [Amorphochlora amoebiformis]